jgi:hypothetical protein
VLANKKKADTIERAGGLTSLLILRCKDQETDKRAIK